MKKTLLLGLLLCSQASHANGLIEKYFYVDYSDDQQPVFKKLTSDMFVDELVKTCDSPKFGKIDTESCYFTLVNELSAFLKSTLKNRFESIKSGAKKGEYTQKTAENVINTERKIQHSFDAYYNLSCTEDSMTSAGSGLGGDVAECQMILLSERIKAVLNSH